MTVFLRILEAAVDEKGEALRNAIASLRNPEPSAISPIAFERDPARFSAVPGSPFAYWVSDGVRNVFERFPRFEAEGRTAKQGLATADDFRFVRLGWEVSAEQKGKRWFGFAKGGAFSPFYADVFLVVDWADNGIEIKNNLNAQGNIRSNVWMLRDTAQKYFFRPGLTWPRRTNGLSFRAMPLGCIFADKGPAAFVHNDSPKDLLALSPILNSSAFFHLLSVQLARTELAQSYEVGLIQQTPIPSFTEADVARLSRLARRAWSAKRSLDTVHETSHAFVLPPGLNEKVTGLHPSSLQRELREIQAQIDDLAFTLYGIDGDDRASIEQPPYLGQEASEAQEHDDASHVGAADADEDSDELDEGQWGWSPGPIYSWLVGVAFGRFDPRLATGERPIPPEPEPFDPLPARSPGMYPEGEEPIFIPPDIMVDDSGHDDDFRTHVADASAKTGIPDPHDLREWLAKEFFPLHIKMYSKSRRKAPIYWQLATPSASYSVWLYLHAFTKDTLFRVQNDYVAPKLALEEQRLELVRQEGGFSEFTDPRPYEEQRLDDVRMRFQKDYEGPFATTRAGKRKELAAQEAFVDELRAFLEEVKRVAPLWNPNLDDGVIINFAPLWRLVPQHKAWQKELIQTWDALCSGKYDWAHLAMHLWPERVVPKCAKDRSLAIAHGLEDIFWVEDDKGKWNPRKTPSRSIDELVQERTSPAVKAALKSLLEAPVPSGSARKTKKGKAHA